MSLFRTQTTPHRPTSHSALFSPTLVCPLPPPFLSSSSRLSPPRGGGGALGPIPGPLLPFYAALFQTQITELTISHLSEHVHNSRQPVSSPPISLTLSFQYLSPFPLAPQIPPRGPS